MEAAPPVKRRRRNFGRSAYGCASCKRRRKACPERYNANGVCERCEIGGFTCVPGKAGIPPSAPSSTEPARPLPQPSAEKPGLPQGDYQRFPPPPPQELDLRSLPFPSVFLPASAGPLSHVNESSAAVAHPVAHPELPTLPIVVEASTSAMQLEDFLPTISSATAAPSNPFSFESTLALPYPVSPFPSYLDLSGSNALTTTSNISNDFSYNPLLDLSYSTALLAMYTSLPPLMPSPNSLVGTGAATGGSRGLIQRRKNGNNKVQKAGFQLRAMMIREAMNDLSEIEGSEQWATSRLDEVVDYYTDVDDEWLCSFPPAERELVKEHLFNSIQSHPSSQAACLAVATVLQLRLLPPEDVEEKRRIIEQGKRHFELAMEKMVGAPLETQIVVLMDSMLHQTEHAGPAAGYATQSLIDTILSAHPSFSHFYTNSPRCRPRPFLASGVGQLNFLLRGLSCMDALRALSLGDRRTFFDLSTFASPSGKEEGPLKDFELVPGALVRASDEFFGGVAPFLVFKAAEVCEVAADAREGVIGAIELRRRAEGLEREMREWAGPAVTVLLQVEHEEEKCEKRRVEIERTREMWREALLIVIHQMLFFHGPLHPSNRASLSRILSLGSMPSAFCSHCAHAPSDSSTPPSSKSSRGSTINTLHIIERALPWFFAATVAVSEGDREIILEALKKKTPLYGGRNVSVVERIWERMDGEGWTLDWRQILREEGITLMLA